MFVSSVSFFCFVSRLIEDSLEKELFQVIL